MQSVSCDISILSCTPTLGMSTAAGFWKFRVCCLSLAVARCRNASLASAFRISCGSLSLLRWGFAGVGRVFQSQVLAQQFYSAEVGCSVCRTVESGAGRWFELTIDYPDALQTIWYCLLGLRTRISLIVNLMEPFTGEQFWGQGDTWKADLNL